MNIIVTIDGKDAIPVRAIPLLTDWEVLSPDVCANAFAGEEETVQNLEGHPTFRLNSDGSHKAIGQRWWANWIVRPLNACSERIAAERISHEVGYQRWRQESLALLPSGVFVWREAFEAAYQQEYGPGSMRVRFSHEPYHAGTFDLNFNPEHGPRNDWRELVMEGFEQFAAAAPSDAPVLALSAVGGSESDKAGPAKPVQRSAAQDAAIVGAIKAAGFSPLALPKNEAGKPGPKAAIRDALKGNPLFVGGTVFDKAWCRLRRRFDIANKP